MKILLSIQNCQTWNIMKNCEYYTFWHQIIDNIGLLHTEVLDKKNEPPPNTHTQPNSDNVW
jgi:hypothetical protein